MGKMNVPVWGNRILQCTLRGRGKEEREDRGQDEVMRVIWEASSQCAKKRNTDWSRLDAWAVPYGYRHKQAHVD